MLSWYRVVRLRRHGQCEERIKCKGNVSGAKKRVILHDRNDGRVVVNA